MVEQISDIWLPTRSHLLQCFDKLPKIDLYHFPTLSVLSISELFLTQFAVSICPYSNALRSFWTLVDLYHFPTFWLFLTNFVTAVECRLQLTKHTVPYVGNFSMRWQVLENWQIFVTSKISIWEIFQWVTSFGKLADICHF